MKKLSEVVNIVPVIAKSDSLTLEEREAFKVRVSGEIKLKMVLFGSCVTEDREFIDYTTPDSR
jgi:septin 3/9/12